MRLIFQNIPPQTLTSGIKQPSVPLDGSAVCPKPRSSSLSAPRQLPSRHQQGDPVNSLTASPVSINNTRPSGDHPAAITSQHTGIRLPSRLPRQAVAKVCVEFFLGGGGVEEGGLTVVKLHLLHHV